LLAADLFCFFFSQSFSFVYFFYLSLLKQPSSRLLSCPNTKTTKPLSGPARHRLVIPLCNPCAHSAVVTSIAGPSPLYLNRTDSKKQTLRNYSTNFEIYRLCITTTTTTTCTAYP
jgi:hypothetical protein